MLDFSNNHFDLFGLPPSFAVDVELLSERYRAMQRELHPDRFAAAGEREKRLSMQASTRINEAYQTLKDPLSRARYLLSLYTGGARDDQETTSDMAFLMEQMDLREDLACAKGQPDPYAAIAAVVDRLDAQAASLTAELASNLEDPGDEQLEQARELLHKLQFVHKCRVEVERVEADLDDAL